MIEEGGYDFFQIIRGDGVNLFENEEGKQFKRDYKVAYKFIRDLFKGVLLKYSLSDLTSGHAFQDADSTFPTYCEHVCEAVIMVSYCNRTKMKVMFDKFFQDLEPGEHHDLDKFAYDFVTTFFVDGYAEQFLLVCSFFIELTIYVNLKLRQNIAESMCCLFGEAFRYLMRDEFKANGGWGGMKKKSRPFWRAYRNYYYNRQNEMKEKGPNAQLKYSADFHNPLLEHGDDQLSKLFKSLGFSPVFKTYKDYPEVQLEECVPRKPSARLSPICEFDLMSFEGEARNDPEGESAGEMETTEKSKQKKPKKSSK